MNLKDKYNNNIILNLIKIYILTYGQFLVTGTPVTQAARIREVLLYIYIEKIRAIEQTRKLASLAINYIYIYIYIYI